MNLSSKDLGLRLGGGGGITAAQHIPPTDEITSQDELPLISIELERLVGYTPSGEDERESIRSQLIEAMWTRFRSTNSDGPSEPYDDKLFPPPDFDDQIRELLDSRVARFGHWLSQEGRTYLEISYPSKLLEPSSRQWKDTAQLWETVQTLSYALEDDDDEEDSCDFWYRLSGHLEDTGRPLFWKQAMASELKDCMERECLHKNHQQWIQDQRKAKLDQLYQVRETLVHQQELAQKDYKRRQDQKEDAIRADLLIYDNQRKRFEKDQGLSFPEEFQLLGLLPKDPLYEEQDWGGTLDDDGDFDYFQSDYSDETEFSSDNDYAAGDEDEHDDASGAEDDGKTHKSFPHEDEASLPIRDESNPPEDDEGIPLKDAAKVVTPSNLFSRKHRERRKKKARAQRKKEKEEARRKEAQKARQIHEHMLEQKHTSQELILSETLVQALDKKVADVEELLESLQDEVWAAEEEEEADESQTEEEDTDALSLLDQILAMILGALPMEGGKDQDPKEHFRYIKEEHEFIVKGWKEYFGRLPPAFVPGKPRNEASIPTKQQPKATVNPTTLNREAPLNTVKLSKITSLSQRGGTKTSFANTTATTPLEQRIALGIVDNEDGEWDDDDDIDERKDGTN